jgi:hypothetical protein
VRILSLVLTAPRPKIPVPVVAVVRSVVYAVSVNASVILVTRAAIVRKLKNVHPNVRVFVFAVLASAP